MLRMAIPLLHVADSARAEDFYCNRLGFRLRSAYRADASRSDPCYLALSRDGVWLHVSSFSGDGVSGGVAHVHRARVGGHDLFDCSCHGLRVPDAPRANQP